MKVVIVGSGLAAYRMVVGLADMADIQVQIVANDLQVYRPDAASLITDATDDSPDIRSAIEKASNLEFCVDTIAALNTRVKAIKGVSGAIYRYDTLVICDSGQSNTVPGSIDFTHNLYSQEARNEFRVALNHLCKISHKSSLRILIIGGGKTGVELAAVLPTYTKMIAQRFSLPAKHITVELFEREHRLLPTMSVQASDEVKKHLEKSGVIVREGTKAVGCGQNIIRTEKQEYAGDLIVYAGGCGYSPIFEKYPEVFEFNSSTLALGENRSVPKASDVFVLSELTESGISPEPLIDAADKLASILAGRKLRKVKLRHAQTVRLGRKWAVYQKGRKIKFGRSGNSLTRKFEKYLAKRIESRK